MHDAELWARAKVHPARVEFPATIMRAPHASPIGLRLGGVAITISAKVTL